MDECRKSFASERSTRTPPTPCCGARCKQSARTRVPVREKKEFSALRAVTGLVMTSSTALRAGGILGRSPKKYQLLCTLLVSARAG